MTDKEKYEALVAEIEHQKEETSIGLNEWENGEEHGRMDVINALQEKIKSMQGEPVSEEQVKESLISKHDNKTCKENGNSLTQEPVSEIDFEQELYKYFGQVKDFTLGMRIAKRFYEIGRNYQESVSEDLEEAASRYAKEEYSRKNPATLPDRCIGCYAPIMYAFKAGANWQKQKDESYTKSMYKVGINTGKELMKQQMIEKAIDWIKEITNHHHIVRYSDSCEPTLSELTECFKNYMKEGGKDE